MDDLMSEEGVHPHIYRSQVLVNELLVLAHEEPSLKQFVERIWIGVRDFTWNGNEEVLTLLEPLYLDFVRLMERVREGKHN